MGGTPGSLRFTLDLPHLKLSIEGGGESLPEVRRIIEAVVNDDGFSEDLELRSRLTDEFVEYQPLARRLKNAVLLDEDVRILKRTIPFEQQEYDLERGQRTSQVSTLNVKTQVDLLFSDLTGTIRECFVHIRGVLDKEQQAVVMDAIKQRLGMEVETRFFATKKNLEGKVLLEAVCFGEGIAEGW